MTYHISANWNWGIPGVKVLHLAWERSEIPIKTTGHISLLHDQATCHLSAGCCFSPSGPSLVTSERRQWAVVTCDQLLHDIHYMFVDRILDQFLFRQFSCTPVTIVLGVCGLEFPVAFHFRINPCANFGWMIWRKQEEKKRRKKWRE